MELRREMARLRTAREDALFGTLNPHTFRRPGRKHWEKAPELVLAGALLSGVAGILLSTKYLSRFPFGEIVFPWQFPIWVLAPVAATGFLLFACIILRPAMFWPVLVGTTVLTAGMFVLRFSILDEWLIGCIVLGGMMAAAAGFVPRRKRVVQRGWVFSFLALCSHLFLLTFVGLFVYGNLKAIRFSMTFLVVLVLGFLLAKYDFPLLDTQRITLLVAGTSLAYYVLYMVHGLAFKESVSVENIIWGIGFAGAGNISVVGIVGVPAAFILIGRERGWRQALGWAVLIMALLVTALGDSRGGMLLLFGSILVTPFAIGIKPCLKIVTVGVVASVVIGTVAFERPQWGLDMGQATIGALTVERGASTHEYFGRRVTGGKRDAGRFLYFRSAIEALLHENLIVALTGAGIYGYFPVAGPYFRELGDRYGIPTYVIHYGASLGKVVEPPRPPAVGAFIVETGLIGMTLLALCGLAAISTTVFRRSRSNKLRFLRGPNILVAASVALGMAWTYFGELQDLMLFYLLLMPFGLVHAWGQMDKGGRSVPAPAVHRGKATETRTE